MAKTILTAEDKNILELSGHSRSDIAEIQSAIKQTSYAVVCDNGERLTISQEEAIRRLGRVEWLRGIARSAFYIDTTRRGLNGERIALHSKMYIS